MHNYECLSAPWSCTVRWSVWQSLMRHPIIPTCSDEKNMSIGSIADATRNLIAPIMNACQGMEHLQSGVLHPGSRCDTQAFQLALMKKFSFRFWLRNQRSARFAQLWMPVSAMVMHCQMQCMAKPDATPKHSNLL